MSSRNVMDEAINAIRSGIYSTSQAAVAFGVPETTLRSRVAKLGIQVKPAVRSYVRTADNPALEEAVSLVMEKGVPVNKASRDKGIPRTTLRKAIKLKVAEQASEQINIVERPGVPLSVAVGSSSELATASASEPVASPSVNRVATTHGQKSALRFERGYKIVFGEDGAHSEPTEFSLHKRSAYYCPARDNVVQPQYFKDDIEEIDTPGTRAFPPPSATFVKSVSKYINGVERKETVTAELHKRSTYFPSVREKLKDLRFVTVEGSDENEALLVVDDDYSFTVQALSRSRSPIRTPPSPPRAAQSSAHSPGDRDALSADATRAQLPPPAVSAEFDFDDRVPSPAPYRPLLSRSRSPLRTPPSPPRAAQSSVHCPVFGDAQSLRPKGEDIYTPSPSPPRADDRVKSPAPPRSSPIAGPSWWSPSALLNTAVRKSSPELSPPINTVSPLRLDNEWVDTDDSGEHHRTQRRTVAEKLQLAEDTPMVKYCPLCDYCTSGNKITRHIVNKHKSLVRRPTASHLKSIGQLITSESRKSYTLVPMFVVQKKLGPYWDDRCFRSIAHGLTVMGRLKVYGGSWNLPGVKDFPNPFAAHLMDAPETVTGFGPLVTPESIITPVVKLPEVPVEKTRIVAEQQELPQQTSVAESSYMSVRKATQDLGLNDQLPKTHPLLQMFAASLKSIHGAESNAANNYVANVSRVLHFVHTQLVESNNPPKHWVDLVSTDVGVYEKYMTLRENAGQTKSTTTNYMKNLRTLFEFILQSYIYTDSTFPKGFDLCPCVHTVTRIKLLEHQLNLMYRRKTKQLPAELFIRKTKEAVELPQHSEVEVCVKKIEAGLPEGLSALEDVFKNNGTVCVRSEKNGTAEEKRVSSLWRKTTSALMLSILWTSKQRSGVVVNMTLGEWESRKHHLTSAVITVSDHKTGDKEPASLVIDEEMQTYMMRYYHLRIRTGYKRVNFFVTNRGEKVNKLYDDINKIYGANLSARLFRIMTETSGRSHDAATSTMVAKALQHSENTALKYYRLPDTEEAIRRQKSLDTVTHTALVKAYVDKHFEDFYPLQPYSKFPNPDEAIEKIKNHEIVDKYPEAVIDVHYVLGLRDRFDCILLDQRVQILYNEVTNAGYTKSNISDHAITDVARQRKVHFFLSNIKYQKKMIKKVIAKF